MYKNTTVTTEELSNTFFALIHVDLSAQANRETLSTLSSWKACFPFFQQEER